MMMRIFQREKQQNKLGGSKTMAEGQTYIFDDRNMNFLLKKS